ncbi:hypothetical protein SB759_30380, partial [Pseudomonas sp. SIMBA_059]
RGEWARPDLMIETQFGSIRIDAAPQTVRIAVDKMTAANYPEPTALRGSNHPHRREAHVSDTLRHARSSASPVH